MASKLSRMLESGSGMQSTDYGKYQGIFFDLGWSF